MTEWIDLCKKIVNWDELITYTKPKVNATNGAKTIGIMLKEGGKLMISNSTPMMVWSPNIYEPKSTGDTYKLDVNMQFPLEEVATDGTRNMLANLNSFQDKVKRDAVEHSMAWFGKKMSDAQVDVLFTELLRYKRDPATGEADRTQPPTFRIKIPFYEDKFKCELYNMKGKSIMPDSLLPTEFPDLIPGRSNLMVIAVNGGIWFANGKFGTTWRLQQAVVDSKQNLSGRCHLVPTVADSDDEEDTENVLKRSETFVTEVSINPTEHTLDKDEDKDEDKVEDEEEKKKTDVTLPKKKKMTKKGE